MFYEDIQEERLQKSTVSPVDINLSSGNGATQEDCEIKLVKRGCIPTRQEKRREPLENPRKQGQESVERTTARLQSPTSQRCLP
jgi:hypothetical protein